MTKPNTTTKTCLKKSTTCIEIFKSKFFFTNILIKRITIKVNVTGGVNSLIQEKNHPLVKYLRITVNTKRKKNTEKT